MHGNPKSREMVREQVRSIGKAQGICGIEGGPAPEIPELKTSYTGHQSASSAGVAGHLNPGKGGGGGKMEY